MSGPCLCGDPECWSCGPAQGFASICPFCNLRACECPGCEGCNVALVEEESIALGKCYDCRAPSPNIGVTRGISGWFAVMREWDPNLGVWEVLNTGPGRYVRRREAEAEARAWALAEELDFMDSDQ